MPGMPHPQPCDHCAAPCCRRYAVVLSGDDAYRIAITLKLPLREFCELRWTDQPDSSGTHYRILLSGRTEGGAEPRFHRLVLRRVPDPEQGLIISRTFYESVGRHRLQAGDPEADLLRRIGRSRLARLRSGITPFDSD